MDEDKKAKAEERLDRFQKDVRFMRRPEAFWTTWFKPLDPPLKLPVKDKGGPDRSDDPDRDR